MKSLTFVGRIIFAVPFVIFGVFHFLNAKSMADTMLQGWPVNTVLVYISGLALILTGVSIMFNLYARLASILLAALLLIFILTLHIKGIGSPDVIVKQLSMTALLKDMGLMGAALTYAGILGKG
ncbi:MAG: DoxX family membrane protein [Bacteroidales bacterium]|nr:DoxX family membrane protein [Bacteroidales bacterium]